MTTRVAPLVFVLSFQGRRNHRSRIRCRIPLRAESLRKKIRRPYYWEGLGLWGAWGYPTEMMRHVQSWKERMVRVDVGYSTIKEAPEYKEHDPISELVRYAVRNQLIEP